MDLNMQCYKKVYLSSVLLMSVSILEHWPDLGWYGAGITKKAGGDSAHGSSSESI